MIMFAGILKIEGYLNDLCKMLRKQGMEIDLDPGIEAFATRVLKVVFRLEDDFVELSYLQCHEVFPLLSRTSLGI